MKRYIQFAILLSTLCLASNVIAQESVLRFSDSTPKNVTLAPGLTVISADSSNNNGLSYSEFVDSGSISNCSRINLTCEQTQVRDVYENDIVVNQESRVVSMPIRFDSASSFNANRLQDGLQIPQINSVLTSQQVSLPSGLSVVALYYAGKEDKPLPRSSELRVGDNSLYFNHAGIGRPINLAFFAQHNDLAGRGIDSFVNGTDFELNGGVVIYANGIVARIDRSFNGSPFNDERSYVYFEPASASFLNAASNGQVVASFIEPLVPDDLITHSPYEPIGSGYNCSSSTRRCDQDFIRNNIQNGNIIGQTTVTYSYAY